MTTVNEMVMPMLGDRFEVALVLMYRLHRSQVRKGSPVPYVAHLLGVAALVLEDGGMRMRRSRRCCMMRWRIRG